MKRIIGQVLNEAEREQAALVLNKVFTLPEDGWFHAVPLGRYPGLLRKPDGTAQQVVQVIDDATCDEIVQAFNKDAGGENFPGLLVDLEHNADAGTMASDTRAAAWIKGVEKRADGIWCKFELTDLGKGLIGGGVYRYQSPTLDVADAGGSDVRPVRIAKSTLTNTPNFRRGLRPLANKETSPDAAGQQKEKTNMDMKAMLLKLLAAMGQEVPADASDEVIGQAHEKCMTEIANKKTGEEADAYIAKNEAKIANKDAFKKAYILNKEAAMTMVDAVVLHAPEAPGQTLNKGDLNTPPPPALDKSDNAEERKNFIGEVANKYGLTGGAAVARAQQLKPELWK